jgi:membrane-bound inhibitor of C-type lysozyme
MGEGQGGGEEDVVIRLQPPGIMKNVMFFVVCISILQITGCSPTNKVADRKSESGRGTFISTNGQLVTAVYFKEGDTWDHATVQLLLPDKTKVQLNLAISASGARYTNETAEWWEHQGEATYDVGGTNIFRGKIISAK